VLAQFDPSDGSGAGVEPGQTVTVTGHVSSGAYLYLRAQSRTGAVFASGEGLFHQLGLEHGGSATVEVSLVHDRLRYALTRPDGTSAGPIATGGLGGPGPDAPVPGPAAGYADSPEEAAHTYVAAINARDGATVCSLFTKTLQQAYNREQMPCWAIVTVYIDFTGENADRAFKNLLLTATGSRRVQTVGGHRYVGVPLTLNFGFARASSASTVDHPQLRQTVDDVLWLEHVGSRWRIAKPSLALMTAGALVRQPGEDPLAAPGATGSTPSTQSTSLG
jgi:hypothetical protein